MSFKPPASPWEPLELADAELIALKALHVGKASESQQKIALATILYKFSGIGDMTFRPGGLEGARATDFAEGKRFVGSRIMEAVTRPMKPSEAAQDANRTDPNASTRRNPKPASGGKPASKSGA